MVDGSSGNVSEMDVWQIVVLSALLAPGWAKLLAMGLNWVHGCPWPPIILWSTRKLNDVLVFLLPILHAVWLWNGGEITASLWLLTAALSAIGAIVLIRDAWRYQFPVVPAWEVGKQVEIRTWPDAHPARRIGRGHGSKLARFPFNEQYSLSIVRREWVLDDLPPDFGELTITHFSDAHFRGAVTRAWYEEVLQEAADFRSDLVVFTGDLLDDERLLEWVPATFGRLHARLGCYFLLGNHDRPFDVAVIRQSLERLGWQDIAGRGVILHDGPRQIFLAGTEVPWMGEHPSQLSATKASLRVLLSHTPDNVEWSIEHGFDVVLAGHTHGGQIRLPILGPVYSPSRYGVRYSAGIFDVSNVKMHVSFGLSGREPLRINCRPEITQLVLRPRQTVPPSA